MSASLLSGHRLCISACVSICLTCHKHKQSCPAAKRVTAFTVSIYLIIVLPKVPTLVVNPDLQTNTMSATACDVFMECKPVHVHAQCTPETVHAYRHEHAAECEWHNSPTNSIQNDNQKPNLLPVISSQLAQAGSACGPHQIAEQIFSEL